MFAFYSTSVLTERQTDRQAYLIDKFSKLNKRQTILLYIELTSIVHDQLLLNIECLLRVNIPSRNANIGDSEANRLVRFSLNFYYSFNVHLHMMKLSMFKTRFYIFLDEFPERRGEV